MSMDVRNNGGLMVWEVRKNEIRRLQLDFRR
jgi:hypothetical protein